VNSQLKLALHSPVQEASCSFATPHWQRVRGSVVLPSFFLTSAAFTGAQRCGARRRRWRHGTGRRDTVGRGRSQRCCQRHMLEQLGFLVNERCCNQSRRTCAHGFTLGAHRWVPSHRCMVLHFSSRLHENTERTAVNLHQTPPAPSCFTLSNVCLLHPAYRPSC